MEFTKRTLLLTLVVVVCFVIATCEVVNEDTDDYLEDNLENEFVENNKNKDDNDELTMKIPGSPIRRLIDPHGTWLAFVRHSERANKRQRVKNARATKKLNALRGPIGPQGPQGPQGLPGAQVTKEVLLEEFRSLVREAAERRIQSIIDWQCEDCNKSSLENTTGTYVPPLFDVKEASIISKLLWGFHCRLEEDAKIPKHIARVELKGFYVPFVQGGFQRGDGIEPQEGRFTVPRKGVYNFVANLHARHRSSRKRRMLHVGPQGQQKPDIVRVMICINSRCLQEASLETVTQMSPSPWKGSIIVNGYLELQKGQYVSIYVHNSDSEAIVIQDSSFFTGSLVGL